MRRALLTVVFMIAAATVGSAQTFYFPQIANGVYDGGSWKTTIFLSNATGAAASGTITLMKSDGTPFVSTWRDEAGNLMGPASSIPFQLGPNQSHRFSSVRDMALTTGFATVTSNSAGVLGNAVFSQFDALGNMVAEAGVPMAVPLGKQAIFVDTTSGFMTGVAIANPNNASLHIHFELVNNDGQIIASDVRDLAPNQHMSFYLNALFPDTPTMVGRLQFYCVNPMVSVALRFEPTFNLFTTMPPIAILP
jgi:hypothetical protein